MKESWKMFVEAFEDIDNQRPVNSIAGISKSVAEQVHTFCLDKSLLKSSGGKGVRMINESYDADTALTQTGKGDIRALVESCGVTGDHVLPAAQAVSSIIGRYFTYGTNVTALLQEGKKIVNEFNTKAIIVSNEDIFSESTVGMLGTFSTEDIGVGMGTVTSDLRTAIAVAIMQFHNGITSRMFHTKNITEAVVQHKREDFKVYNIEEDEEYDKDLIELHKNPKEISNELIRIIPMKDNDSTTEPVLQADGIIKFGVEAPLLKLSLDETRPQYAKMNRTDLVADSVRLDTIYFELTDDFTTELYAVKVPTPLSRLVMVNNSAHSAIRGASVEINTFVNKATPLANGSTNTLFAGLDAKEGLNVTLIAKPEINLRNGKITALGMIKTKKHHAVDDEQISAELDTLYANIYSAGGPTLYGYEPDARYSEENLRKSSIAARVQTRPIVWPLPAARNYILDTTIMQAEEDNGIQHMSSLVSIGTDDVNITMAKDAIDEVFNMVQQMFTNPLNVTRDPGHNYVAGSITRPRVIKRNIDIADIKSYRDSDLTSDIRAIAQAKISNLLEQLHIDTMIQPQLPAGTRPVYRVATSGLVLNNILAFPHIHNHLNVNRETPGTDGVEYTVVLDSGVQLQIVTSLFDYMENEAIFVPIILNDPDSILNFAVAYAHSTTSGSFQITEGSGAVFNRSFVAERKYIYPTNPTALHLTFTNLDKAVRLD